MRNPGFMFGVILGGAFVAACLNDTFRETCRRGLYYIGNEANGQISNLWREFANMQNGQKGQQNEHERISQA